MGFNNSFYIRVAATIETCTGIGIWNTIQKLAARLQTLRFYRAPAK
jgi:hypothetical protein